MTKKDFELIAQTLNRLQPSPTAHEERYDQWKITIHQFATILSGTNPKFNTTKFLKACHNLQQVPK